MNTSTALSRWVIFVLALGAGFSVAAIYYAQPLLPLIGQDLTLSLTGSWTSCRQSWRRKGHATGGIISDAFFRADVFTARPAG